MKRMGLISKVALSLLVLACTTGDGRPIGKAELLGSWEETEAIAVIVYRISCEGDLAIERWGITVRVDSNLRRYWTSLVVDQRLPPGAATSGTLRLPFAGEEESLIEGSAVVEAAWFE